LEDIFYLYHASREAEQLNATLSSVEARSAPLVITQIKAMVIKYALTHDPDSRKRSTPQRPLPLHKDLRQSIYLAERALDLLPKIRDSNDEYRDGRPSLTQYLKYLNQFPERYNSQPLMRALPADSKQELFRLPTLRKRAVWVPFEHDIHQVRDQRIPRSAVDDGLLPAIIIVAFVRGSHYPNSRAVPFSR
jgi:hypothetical protein